MPRMWVYSRDRGVVDVVLGYCLGIVDNVDQNHVPVDPVNCPVNWRHTLSVPTPQEYSSPFYKYLSSGHFPFI